MRQIDYSRVAQLLQAPFMGLAIYWFVITPAPNYAVDVLGVAAAVMAVRATAKSFAKTEQVIWILLAVMLCMIEFRAIREDQVGRDEKEDARRWQDDFNRRQERRLFSALLRSGNMLLNTEKILSKTTMDALTGGDSFCYVELRPFWGPNVLEALLLEKGIDPVLNVEITVTDTDLVGLGADLSVVLPKAQSRYSFPFVRAGSFATPLFQLTTPPSSQSKNYDVFIIARNGLFTERLRLRRVKNEWLSAKRVDASYYNKRHGLVLEEIDKGFPMEALDADSEWKAVDKLRRIKIH